MRNYLLITTLLLICHFSSLCQYSEERRNEIQRVDSLKIDNLKKQLPALTGIARIDSMLSLAVKYGDIVGIGGFVHRHDSAYRYLSLANEEAKKIGYKKGMGKALVHIANYEVIFAFKNKTNFSVAEKYLQQGIKVSEEINDNEMLGFAYVVLSKIKNNIENYKKAYDYYVKARNQGMQALMASWLCEMLSYKGEYEEGIEYCHAALKLYNISAKKSANSEWGHSLVLDSYNNLRLLYEAAGDYETALNYLSQARQYAASFNMGPMNDDETAELFITMNQIDSAIYYLNRFKNKKPSDLYEANWNQTRANLISGKIFLLQKDYDKAINIFKPVIDTFSKKNKKKELMEPLIDMGKAFAGKGDYKKALKYVNEGTNLAIGNGNRPIILKGYHLLSQTFYHLNKPEMAYQYLQKYIDLKDSIQNRQFLWKLKSYKMEAEEEKRISQINLLKKDNQLKEQKLKQEATVKKSLIAGLVLLLLLGVFIFRILTLKRKNDLVKQKLENEKKQAELQQKAVELEMQALRAQMNPHFIFNCLSSINKFILKNDTDTASDYLTRFSRLIRQVLTNSQLTLIPLSDEIETLRLYLDMERLRFSESFTYNIIYENTIEPETIYIPPMLLQPFCENAIWHGLMHKEGPGKLDIVMSTQNGELQCIIADNGIGREKAAALKTKTGTRQKSFGLKITTDRLALFNNEKAVHSFYRTEDLLDEGGTITGTKVILNIKFKNTAEQPVKELI